MTNHERHTLAGRMLSEGMEVLGLHDAETRQVFGETPEQMVERIEAATGTSQEDALEASAIRQITGEDVLAGRREDPR